MVSVHQVQQLIVSQTTTMPHEMVPLSECVGRVLAQDLRSRATSPSTDVAALHGYGVMSSDTHKLPVTLRVVGESTAGNPYNSTIEPGECVRIFRGSPLVEGMDAIVNAADVEESDDIITLNVNASMGDNILYTGVDFQESEVYLKRGKTITARDMCLMAAMNITWVAVRRKPRIAVLCIGNELLMPGDLPQEGRVFAATNLALCAFINACGGIATNLGICPDDMDAIQVVADAAYDTDLLLTTGGISLGAHDLLRDALQEKGYEINAMSLDIGHNEPLVFGNGQRNHTPFLSFPGNPATGMLFATLFLKPVIFKLLGAGDALQERRFALLGRNLDVNDKKLRYLRARLTRNANGNLVVDPFSAPDNYVLSSLCDSDCLVVVDSAHGNTGDEVEIIKLDYASTRT